jgi:hypothetical protein
MFTVKVDAKESIADRTAYRKLCRSRMFIDFPVI